MIDTYSRLNGKIVRVLSVQWPWSEFLASGIKKVENRTRRLGTNLLGQYVFIHTSKKISWYAFSYQHVCSSFLNGTNLSLDLKKILCNVLGSNWHNGQKMNAILKEFNIFPNDIGKIVAMVKFDEIWEPGINELEGNERIWRAEDQYGLYFPSAHRLRSPVETRGALGFWKYDASKFEPVDIGSISQIVSYNETKAA